MHEPFPVGGALIDAGLLHNDFAKPRAIRGWLLSPRQGAFMLQIPPLKFVARHRETHVFGKSYFGMHEVCSIQFIQRIFAPPNGFWGFLF